MSKPTLYGFEPFPKMARLSREAIITEKIDGTNAQVFISEGDLTIEAQIETVDLGKPVAVIEGKKIFVGSRNRWISPEDDNFGFARWVKEHADEVALLGPGRHFGEWWGRGIQRGYDIPDRRLSLFNVSRWCKHDSVPELIPSADPRIQKMQEVLPPSIGLVPVLSRGVFSTEVVGTEIERLRTLGSVAAPGFMRPEGVVVWHTAAGVGFKKTLEHDESPKSRA
jgi:hypothetical protein